MAKGDNHSLAPVVDAKDAQKDLPSELPNHYYISAMILWNLASLKT